MVAQITTGSHGDDSMNMAYWLDSHSAQSSQLLLLNGSDNCDFYAKVGGSNLFGSGRCQAFMAYWLNLLPRWGSGANTIINA